MGCCWPKNGGKKDPKTWAQKFAHVRPLPEREFREATAGYKAYLDQQRAMFKRKLSNPVIREEETSNFELSSPLGKGTLGPMTLAQHKPSGTFYAAEIISIKDVAEAEFMGKVSREKQFLSSLGSHFVVELIFVCHSPAQIYLIKELSHYGNFYHCVTSKMCLTNRQATIYAAQIVLALEYLHHCRVLHRDLRSENLVVMRDGYLKLTDFSTAKVVSGYTSTFIGSLNNMPPEMVKRQMYSKGVDWWALGILLYEMVSGGKLAFQKPDTMKRIRCKEKILRDEPLFNDDLCAGTKDIISKLLEKKPSRRLGSWYNGADDVKGHVFFLGINFFGIHEKKYKIEIDLRPFVPPVAPPTPESDTDHSYRSF